VIYNHGMVDSASEHAEGLNPIQTRQINKEDLALIQIILEQWVRHWKNNQLIPEEIAGIIKNMENSLTSEDSSFYIAETPKDGIIGVVGIKTPSEKMKEFTTSQKAVELVNFFVDKKHRGGKGVGSTLLRRIESEVIKVGKDQIVLNSGRRYQESWGFYDKIGFERVGIAKDIYGVGNDAPVWLKQVI